MLSPGKKNTQVSSASLKRHFLDKRQNEKFKVNHVLKSQGTSNNFFSHSKYELHAGGQWTENTSSLPRG